MAHLDNPIPRNAKGRLRAIVPAVLAAALAYVLAGLLASFLGVIAWAVQLVAVVAALAAAAYVLRRYWPALRRRLSRRGGGTGTPDA